MNKEDLRAFVLANPKLVTMRPLITYPGLFVLKYTRRVFYDALWNDYLEECRGTIVDEDFAVVARPFHKIYNFRVEAKSPVLPDSHSITAYRKVNGFMCCLTWYKDDILVSTTGSTDSDFVAYVKEMMLTHMCWADWQMEVLGAAGMSLMFECVHPSDPHIVPEKAGMYFLGIRENSWDSHVKMSGVALVTWARDYATSHLKCFYAEGEVTTVGELVALSKTVKHEGFVFYDSEGVSAKIKSPYYLINKFVARNPRTDKLMSSQIKETIDEEYYDLVDAIQANIVEFTAKTEQERLVWVQKFLEAQ